MSQARTCRVDVFEPIRVRPLVRGSPHPSTTARCLAAHQLAPRVDCGPPPSAADGPPRPGTHYVVKQPAENCTYFALEEDPTYEPPPEPTASPAPTASLVPTTSSPVVEPPSPATPTLSPTISTSPSTASPTDSSAPTGTGYAGIRLWTETTFLSA